MQDNPWHVLTAVKTKVKQKHLDDPFLQEMEDMASSDDDKHTVWNHLKDGTALQELKRLPMESPVHSYLSVLHRHGVIYDVHKKLMTCDHSHLVVPKRY